MASYRHKRQSDTQTMTLIAVLKIFLVLALAGTVAVLFTGIIIMSRGGEFHARYGNLLMRLRVITQGLAVALFALLMLLT